MYLFSKHIHFVVFEKEMSIDESTEMMYVDCALEQLNNLH